MNNEEISNLRRDIAEHAAALRVLKGRLRSPWRIPMGAVQREVLRRAAEVTELLCLRAWLRGRDHLPDRERSRETAQRIAVARGMTSGAATIQGAP